MAEQASSGSHSQDLTEHRQTYDAFLRGSVGLTLLCAFILVALVSFRFAASWNVLFGFATIILGVIGVVIDARTGNSRWTVSLVLLAVMGLITAVNVA